MGTVNLHVNYKQPLVEAFDHTSVLTGKSTTEFDWRGNSAIVLTDIETDELHDYNRTASSNRYGTPTEVADRQQLLELQRDRSFSKTVDKGNYQESNYLKKGASVIKAYMSEQVSPEMEKLAFGELAGNAGQVVAVTSAPTKSTILETVLSVETKMDDARVPKANRFLAIANSYVALLKQSLLDCDDITDEWVRKGLIGRIGTLHILPTVGSDLPTNCYMIGWQRRSFANPKTIEDAKVSKDVPGNSGILIEGRFRFGAFVVGKRANGVVALVASSSKCATPTATKSTTTTITSSTEDAVIRYTLDGSDPRYSKTAIIYSAAIANPEEGTKLRAVATKNGMFASDVLNHTCA